MPYTLNGRWFPVQWFEEMGLPVPANDGERSYDDVPDDVLIAAWQEYYAAVDAREQEEQRRREAEEAAERERLAREAIEAALREAQRAEQAAGALDRVREAFAPTMFTVRQEQVYRFMLRPDDGQLPLIEEGEAIPEPQPEFIEVPGHIAIVNGSTNQTLSIKTDDYEIIQDTDILERYLAIFEAANVIVEPVRHHVTRSKDGVLGRTTFMELRLPDHELPNEDCRIVITNSNDGSLKNRFCKIYFNRDSGRMQVAWEQRPGFAVRHRTGASERIIHELQSYLQSSNQTEVEARATLNRVHGVPDSIAAYLENNPILSGARNAEKLMGAWMVAGTPADMWSVYCVFANVITETYGRNFGSKLAKLEHLNREVRTNWGRVIHMTNMPTTRDLLHGQIGEGNE